MTNYQKKNNNSWSKTPEVEVAEVIFLLRKQIDIDGMKNMIQNDFVIAPQAGLLSSFNSNSSRNIIVIKPNEYAINKV